VDRRDREAILGEWGLRDANARELAELTLLEQDLEGSPLRGKPLRGRLRNFRPAVDRYVVSLGGPLPYMRRLRQIELETEDHERRLAEAWRDLAGSCDGDAFAIGGGHFIHAARRNLDICYVIMDNSIYGLTKGQTSPTSMVGFITKTTPKGTPDRPVNPLQLALASGATFVARAFSGKPKELADLIVQGIDHKGFAIIDAYSPCPTFNKVNTFKYYRDQALELPKDHNASDVMQAWARAQSTDPVYLGVLYRSEGESSFEEHIQSAQSGTDADAPQVIESILARYS